MNRIFYCLILVLVFTSSCKVFHEANTEHSKYDLNSDANIDSDTEIDALIAPYKKDLDIEMNQVIGYCEKELIKSLPECTLGNWSADAIFEQCNKVYDGEIDFAVVNYGGIRIPSLPQGDVTVGKIFELMPFDNMLVILKVDGSIVQQLFENIAGRGGWPVSKGVICTYNAAGELLDLSINGNKLDNDKIYKIGITDYVANGGDKCDFFKGQPQIETGVLYRDAFMQQVKDETARNEKVNADVDGRMIVR